MPKKLYHPTAKGTATARKAVATKFALAKFRVRFFEGTKAVTGTVPTLEAELEFGFAVKRAARARVKYYKRGLEGGTFYILEEFLKEYFEDLAFRYRVSGGRETGEGQ